ncbi:related to thioredoxin reductase [Ramularia collo-cygni]|uniref:Related to thioredoxin reductase n=1 Tax=Ramularia collo-cygni TaxID=112498 RepID=A0A2D3VEE0_9PEZI|nr:related to thioredoxin reductase [Ramularia collo-cygni]CZT21194.1 related to thioredoxin reductase [Ramularia collo-cygni]
MLGSSPANQDQSVTQPDQGSDREVSYVSERITWHMCKSIGPYIDMFDMFHGQIFGNATILMASLLFLRSRASYATITAPFSQAVSSIMSGNQSAGVSDVLVIGGGPGGLSVATGLARQLYTTIVFDNGVYRNARSQHMHNVAGWDHQSPAAFREKSRQDLLDRYDTIRFEDVAIEAVRKNAAGLFEADDATGRTWTGRKLMLATGVRDVYPDIPGYDEVWGYRVYHCLFCHGFEQRNAKSVGVLAIGDLSNPKVALHMAYQAQRLAQNVVVYTDGASDVAEQVELGVQPGFKITVEQRSIERLSMGPNNSEVVVQLSGGEEQVQGFLVHRPKAEVNGPFARQLALELTEAGDIKTSQPFHETSVSGCFAVGDCATYMKAVTSAISMGALGAGGLASQLQMLPPVAPGKI